MSFLNAIFQGLLQGFTEFLPVSSSGHLSLFQYFTGVNSEGSVLFSVLLHFGTLAAVIIAFWPTIWALIQEAVLLLRDIFTLRVTKVKPNSKRRMIYMLILSCFPLLLVLLVQDRITALSADNSILAEGVCFLGTALLLTLADHAIPGKKTAKTMTGGDALVIGTAQLMATLPGISRSGSTISAGLIMGLSRSYAVAYSFILGLPAVLAAGLLDLKDLMSGTGAAASLEWGPALVGMVVAAISGFFAIKLVNYIVNTNKFRIFAIYTAVLGTVVVILGIIEIVTGNAIQGFIVGLLA
ncbi:undecaprenyl-diphosphate phosphatase [Angelakisella massiliensis]|uniref:undecaprenyl-diphosphate phosphatase n=1 Tax=Angelakisella massiliensis TaxID=1871018 RepID=UPI0024B14CD7|nr:undecaprenyl-diphosphate phosphatase [Angelakisella massiliensis]